MVDFKRLVVISLRFKGKEIGNSPWWPLQGNLSGSSTDPCSLLFFALLLDCARFTSWRGNLSASPSAKPSGCDRAGGVKFTGWRMSRLELLLTQWVAAYRLDQGFWPAAAAADPGTSQELERGPGAPEPESPLLLWPALYTRLCSNLVYKVHGGVSCSSWCWCWGPAPVTRTCSWRRPRPKQRKGSRKLETILKTSMKVVPFHNYG